MFLLPRGMPTILVSRRIDGDHILQAEVPFKLWVPAIRIPHLARWKGLSHLKPTWLTWRKTFSKQMKQRSFTFIKCSFTCLEKVKTSGSRRHNYTLRQLKCARPSPVTSMLFSEVYLVSHWEHSSSLVQLPCRIGQWCWQLELTQKVLRNLLKPHQHGLPAANCASCLLSPPACQGPWCLRIHLYRWNQEYPLHLQHPRDYALNYYTIPWQLNLPPALALQNYCWCFSSNAPYASSQEVSEFWKSFAICQWIFLKMRYGELKKLMRQYQWCSHQWVPLLPRVSVQSAFLSASPSSPQCQSSGTALLSQQSAKFLQSKAKDWIQQPPIITATTDWEGVPTLWGNEANAASSFGTALRDSWFHTLANFSGYLKSHQLLPADLHICSHDQIGLVIGFPLALPSCLPLLLHCQACQHDGLWAANAGWAIGIRQAGIWRMVQASHHCHTSAIGLVWGHEKPCSS